MSSDIYEVLPRINIEKLTEKEIIFTLTGDQHGIPNLIAKLAIKKPYISYAAYVIDHPLISKPKIIIVTDGKKHPLEALREILLEAKKTVEEFRSKILDILPEK
jgi:DNA-directed RNA polymerase subunit L